MQTLGMIWRIGLRRRQKWILKREEGRCGENGKIREMFIYRKR